MGKEDIKSPTHRAKERKEKKKKKSSGSSGFSFADTPSSDYFTGGGGGSSKRSTKTVRNQDGTTTTTTTYKSGYISVKIKDRKGRTISRQSYSPTQNVATVTEYKDGTKTKTLITPQGTSTTTSKTSAGKRQEIKEALTEAISPVSTKISEAAEKIKTGFVGEPLREDLTEEEREKVGRARSELTESISQASTAKARAEQFVREEFIEKIISPEAFAEFQTETEEFGKGESEAAYQLGLTTGRRAFGSIVRGAAEEVYYKPLETLATFAIGAAIPPVGAALKGSAAAFGISKGVVTAGKVGLSAAFVGLKTYEIAKAPTFEEKFETIGATGIQIGAFGLGLKTGQKIVSFTRPKVIGEETTFKATEDFKPKKITKFDSSVTEFETKITTGLEVVQKEAKTLFGRKFKFKDIIRTTTKYEQTPLGKILSKSTEKIIIRKGKFGLGKVFKQTVRTEVFPSGRTITRTELSKIGDITLRGFDINLRPLKSPEILFKAQKTGVPKPTKTLPTGEFRVLTPGKKVDIYRPGFKTEFKPLSGGQKQFYGQLQVTKQKPLFGFGKPSTIFKQATKPFKVTKGISFSEAAYRTRQLFKERKPTTQKQVRAGRQVQIQKQVTKVELTSKQILTNLRKLESLQKQGKVNEFRTKQKQIEKQVENRRVSLFKLTERINREKEKVKNRQRFYSNTEYKVIIKGLSKIDNKVKSFSDVAIKQRYKPFTAIKPLAKQKVRQKQKIKSLERIIEKTATSTKITKVPLLLPTPDRERKGPARKAYNVFVRESRPKGKSKVVWRKLNRNTPLPKKKAFNLGAFYVDRTTAATFQIRPKGTTKLRDDKRMKLTAKFRPKKRGSKIGGVPLWIEKNKYRIDTPTEFAGITVKGLQTIRAKRGLM